MRVLVELSGEHPTLPRAEALAAFEAEAVTIREARWSTGVLRVDAEGRVLEAVHRLGLAHVISEELAEGSFEDVQEAARAMDLGGRTFRVRARGLGIDVDPQALEGSLGAALGRTGTVRLTRPDVDLRLLVGETCVLGRVVHRVGRSALEARKVARRTFSLPISLHPKLARALVNLSRVPIGGRVLDPFVGTGGVLLEAARLGIRAPGGDLRRDMVEGARASLRALGAEADLVVADAGRGPWRRSGIEGIATDPPYGRAASTRGEPVPDLYDRAFAAFADVLRPGGHAAVILPDARAEEIGGRHLELLERHPMRVHRSLTRTFCVFRRR
ncbi:MAG: hypothetical protein A3K68_02955 [Euryarchaeota archaeon RBG_16_68_13]|nr:MAG: hypothetical protein A3K68_02955 [Euryarchaeota archaeon RBG_16_68_13]